jgi:hypothetical protein
LQIKTGLPFGLNNLQGIFFVWFLGLASASLVHVLEYSHFLYRKKYIS